MREGVLTDEKQIDSYRFFDQLLPSPDNKKLLVIPDKKPEFRLFNLANIQKIDERY